MFDDYVSSYFKSQLTQNKFSIVFISVKFISLLSIFSFCYKYGVPNVRAWHSLHVWHNSNYLNIKGENRSNHALNRLSMYYKYSAWAWPIICQRLYFQSGLIWPEVYYQSLLKKKIAIEAKKPNNKYNQPHCINLPTKLKILDEDAQK